MDLSSLKDAATDEYFKQPVVVSCSTQCVCVCVCVKVSMQHFVAYGLQHGIY